MNCKVIATSFSPVRNVRTPVERTLTFPDHYQEITTSYEALDQIKGVIAFELAQNPGVPCDVVIVNSDVGFAPGNEYLENIKGTKTNYGTIRVLQRPNNQGWSFGAFNYAYQQLKNEYQYFMFTEDDIMIGGNRYYFEHLEILQMERDAGFLALVKLCPHSRGTHAGGGVGLVSTKILNEVNEKYGSLPHYMEDDLQEQSALERRANIISGGEIPFTNAICQLGYKIIGNRTRWGDGVQPYYDYKHGPQNYVIH